MKKLLILVLILASVQVFGQKIEIDGSEYVQGVIDCTSTPQPCCGGKGRVMLDEECCEYLVVNGETGSSHLVNKISREDWLAMSPDQLAKKEWLYDNIGDTIMPPPPREVISQGMCAVRDFVNEEYTKKDIAAICAERLGPPPCKDKKYTFVRLDITNKGVILNRCKKDTLYKFDPKFFETRILNKHNYKDITICSGQSALINGVPKNVSGTYIEKSGDSTIYVNLDLIEPIETFSSELGEVKDTLTQYLTSKITGCDSIHKTIILPMPKVKTPKDPCIVCIKEWEKAEGFYARSSISSGQSPFLGDDKELSPLGARSNTDFGHQWRSNKNQTRKNRKREEISKSKFCYEKSTAIGVELSTLNDSFYENPFCVNCENNQTKRNPFILKGYIERKMHRVSLYDMFGKTSILTNTDLSIGGRYTISYAPSDIKDITTQEKKFHDFSHELSIPLEATKTFRLKKIQLDVFIGSSFTANRFLKAYASIYTGAAIRF